jgi:tripartite motif-containing protein 2/3/tripartite motif-containing protein 71
MQLVDRDRHGRLSLPCPTCRQVTAVPAKGVAGLQPLLFVSHQLAVLVGKGDVGLIPHGGVLLHCSVHPDGALKLFCNTCGCLVCSACCKEEGGHYGHTYIELREVLARTRVENGASVESFSVSSTECNLVSELLGTQAQGSLERTGRCMYHISYQPTIKGRHQLHIKVAGRHVPGSPFSVLVKAPVETLSTPVRTLGKLQRPWGVALTRSGEIVVSEYSGHRVSVWTPRGERRSSFGTSGSGPGQFDHPCEVAVDGAGNIVVADSWNHRIQKFSPDGQFLKQAGKGEGANQFRCSCPIGIAYNTFNDNLYVVDGTNRVHVLDSDLVYQRSFGGEGNSEGLVNTPWSVACDGAGKVYVADSYNNRVQVFSAEGEFLWLFGRRGTGRGELGWPAGITVDLDGMVYVSEGDNCRVSIFTPKGQFVSSFGRKGEGPGGFGAVRGLAVDSSGVLYLCDRDNQFLHMF